ncbi:restriction endonuclease [Cohnella lupini]|uniref:Restriction system protein n=1 Tax=Cohnella lupini TaxID=1294267 RepID=A0A3D9IBD3_9BACL|nr:restriction endonuclease [Cohnella lupini]RED58516.1 restriction system protein [Cohnella lupini]
MARKSADKKREEAYKSLIGLVFIGSLSITYYISKSATAAVIVGLCALGTLIAVNLIQHQKRENRLKQSGIAEIDKMDGIIFERYLQQLFKAQGYQVEVTQAIGDFGADLIMVKNGIKIVVQAKRHASNVGIKAVQEAQAAIAHYGASEAWVVTNSNYTDAAYQLAKSNQVKLINREALIEMILSSTTGTTQDLSRIQTAATVEALAQSGNDLIETNNKLCKRCGSTLVLRKGPKGPFYGCTSFPKCRYTTQS